MKIFLYIFVPILLLTFYNCVETSNPLQPQSPEPRVFIKSIVPSQLQVGMDLRVVVGYENGHLDWYSNGVINNGIWHSADSVRGDTIYSYIPYLHFAPLYRELGVMASIDNIYYYDVDTVYVFPNTCLSGVCVDWNDLKTIAEKDSYAYDWGIRWTGTQNQDTIVLQITLPGCDEGEVEQELKFISRGAQSLPEFYSLKSDNRCLGEVITDSLKNGLIKIQDWNVNGIVSGYVFSELLEDWRSNYDIWPKKMVFWFDFSN